MKTAVEISEEEKRLLALWGAEAAKMWWLELSDAERAEFATMTPDRLFVIGYQAACLRSERQADARRFRFIEANRWGVWFNDRANAFIVQSRNQTDGNIGQGRTVREAVDAAIDR